MGTIPVGYHQLRVQRFAMSHITKETQMKTLIGIVVISLVLLSGGCSSSTPPQQAQPGAQGQPGQTGQAGQPGEAGQTGQAGQTGEAGQTGQPGEAGESGQTGRTGQTGQTGQTGEQGKAAPCPAGQHRHTNPDTGVVRCVAD